MYTVAFGTISEVPSSANIIRFHFIYELELSGNKSLSFKIRVGAYGSEDTNKAGLLSDIAMCRSLGM